MFNIKHRPHNTKKNLHILLFVKVVFECFQLTVERIASLTLISIKKISLSSFVHHVVLGKTF